ncbi:MAG: NAD(P)H-dependent oxidoreductase [Amphritea sp.]
MATSKDASVRIVIIPGSVRPGNYTDKAVALVADEISKYRNVSLDVIDFKEIHLPFPGTAPESPEMARFKETVSQATGVIFATPEYHGTFSSITKLAIENLGFPSVLAGKPVALLGVAAGAIGAIKSLEQLRGVCSHVGAIVLPAPVSVAGVQGIFDEDGRCNDEMIEKRVRHVATNLLDYINNHICPGIGLEDIVRSSDH